MDFKPEWNQRFQIWMDELPKYFYKSLGKIQLEGFTTFDHLSPEQALQAHFSPMPVGTTWGEKWEYGWFRAEVKLPKKAAGNRIVMQMNMGGEALIWVNGRTAGARDREHTTILLTSSAKGDETFQLLAESYAGHGPRLENGTPCPPGTVTIPEPPLHQAAIEESTYGIWNEDAYQLWMDYQTLYQLRECLDQKSLRWQKIDHALREATIIINFEQESESERNETFRAAREILAPELACHNGSTAPVMYTFGQSHLDLSWLWPWQETTRKSARTVSNQMSLLEEYPDYRFLWCEPPLYQALEEYYPETYARVKQYMKEGRIFADGAMWVESDTNLPSGESLIRQILYGRKFYREELNTESNTVWLPDCFGFTAALPQIMKGCGVRYFATQKIIRNYNGGDPFPYNIFQWEGIDGTKILSHIFKKNNAYIDPKTVITRWNEDRNQEEDIDSFLYPFGHGDGGGGATRNHVEFMSRMEDLEGMPRMKVSTLDEFFRHIEKQGTQNRYVGELYFQCHRGTYTSQAIIKRKNRTSEFMLREAEVWSTLAGLYNLKCMENLWKETLFNQFHDIVTGASIRRVCEEAEMRYDRVINECGDIIKSAQKKIAGGDHLTIFNSLSWARTVQIMLPDGYNSAKNDKGEVLPCQKLANGVITESELPSLGYRSIIPLKETKPKKQEPIPDKLILENEYVRVLVNAEGQLVSVLDLKTGFELLSAPANVFHLYRDTTVKYEAWDIDHIYPQMETHPETRTVVTYIEYGLLRQVIQIEKHFSHSTLSQNIILHRNSRQIEFETTVDWHEHHKMLRVDFPTSIKTDEAYHEIQFGYLKRPTHRSRQYDKDRFEVVNHKYTALCEENRGIAVLNDCKYGVRAEEGTISLTLLRSPKVPDMSADMGVHHFTYAFDFWNEPFFDCDVVRKGYELNVPPMMIQGTGSRSFLQIDAPNVILDGMKFAEDDSGDIILRLYECKHASVSCRLTITLNGYSNAVETDMCEKEAKAVKVEGGIINLTFHPFEIKTIRLINTIQ